MHHGCKNIFLFLNKKKILITGNTGFKGSWLTIFLSKFNCKLYGYSNGIITKPSFFESADLKRKIKTYIRDIQDYEELNKIINVIRPDIIFHFAAQSLVPKSIQNPKETILTNTIGTLNILEVLKNYKKKLICVIVTSDKCYYPQKNKSYFIESDYLGGEDPYSASKACAEIIYKSFYETYLKKKKNINTCTVRAGNVVGGGDWSKDRIMTDIFKSINNKSNLILRNPNSNRPWQHVIEPLWAYILLSKELSKGNFNGENFNIGPNSKNNKTVKYIAKQLIKKMNSNIKIKFKKKKFTETYKLNLNTQKIETKLSWKRIFNNNETLDLIISWYLAFKKKNKLNLYKKSQEQIDYYLNLYFHKK
jgi:CDP-glucose 4,6-dehydratase